MLHLCIFLLLLFVSVIEHPSIMLALAKLTAEDDKNYKISLDKWSMEQLITDPLRGRNETNQRMAASRNQLLAISQRQGLAIEKMMVLDQPTIKQMLVLVRNNNFTKLQSVVLANLITMKELNWKLREGTNLIDTSSTMRLLEAIKARNQSTIESILKLFYTETTSTDVFDVNEELVVVEREAIEKLLQAVKQGDMLAVNTIVNKQAIKTQPSNERTPLGHEPKIAYFNNGQMLWFDFATLMELMVALKQRNMYMVKTIIGRSLIPYNSLAEKLPPFNCMGLMIFPHSTVDVMTSLLLKRPDLIELIIFKHLKDATKKRPTGRQNSPHQIG